MCCNFYVTGVDVYRGLAFLVHRDREVRTEYQDLPDLKERLDLQVRFS
jgi:hypothetical protein